jgi:raffinose/stachyose/melibiose transport system substrate-binding protein
MKKILLVLFVLIVGSFTVYAGPGSDKGGAAGGGQKVVIRMYHSMAQLSKQVALKKLEEDFTKRYPNVTFEDNLYNNGAGDYYQQVSTALASGDQPNIIMGIPMMYTDVVNNGFAMDLSNNEVIKSLNLSSGDLGNASVNGTLYGFPIDFVSCGVFYNVDMFEKLGLQVPKTHNELMEVCRRIKASGVDPWIYMYGDASVTEKELRATFWPRAYEAGDFDFYENLMNGKKKLADYPYILEGLQRWQERTRPWPRNDAMASNQDKGLEMFVSGQGAMVQCGSWNVGDIVNKGGPNFRFDYFVYPFDNNPADLQINITLDQQFMINPKAPNADIALKFLEFWATDGALEYSETAMMPLASGKVSGTLPKAVQTIASLKQGKMVHYGDFKVSFNTQYNTAWRRQLTRFAESIMTGGTMTPEQCIANIQEAFDNIRSTTGR